MKKTLSLILSLLMIFSLFAGLTVSAEDDSAVADGDNTAIPQSSDDDSSLYQREPFDLAETGSVPMSGTTGDCTWRFDYATATLTIGGSGAMADYIYDKYQSENDSPWKDFYRDIEKVVIGNGVTYIGKEAFQHVFYLTDIKLGKNVKTIGERAFAGTCVETLTIPDSVETIGEGAFSYNENLQTVKFGKNVKSIGKGAFQHCDLDGVTIPDSVESIGDFAFAQNNGLKTLKLGKNLKAVGRYAFFDCGMMGVSLPKSITEMGEYAFGYYDTSYYDTSLWTAEPVDGFTVYGYQSTYAQGYAIANSFRFRNLSSYSENYSLWVGGTQVTSANKDDILGGGTAKYDPIAGVLTLKNPTLNAGAQPAIIYAEGVNLMITGAASINAGELPKAILSEDGALTFAGDFTVSGTIACDMDLTVKSGTLTVKTIYEVDDGIVSESGKITVCSDVERLDVSSQGNALLARCDIYLKGAQRILTPEGYKHDKDPDRTDYYTFLTADGDGASAVVIEPYYGLWLGSTPVTPFNRRDILGDGGKAQYNPYRESLYLNDPVIEGKAPDADGYNTKIFATNKTNHAASLRIRGSYHMDGIDPTYGIEVDGFLILDGDFAFYGRDVAVYAYRDVAVRSGRLLAVAKRGEGICALNGEIYIYNTIERIEARSNQYRAIYANKGLQRQEGVVISAPRPYTVSGQSVLDGSKNEAKTVVIKNGDLPGDILGDADTDGEVTILDATAIQRKLAGFAVSGFSELLAEVDGDGEITIIDATYIQRYLAGLSAPAGIGKPV